MTMWMLYYLTTNTEGLKLAEKKKNYKPANAWKPGDAPFAKWRATLTDEQWAAEIERRKKNRSIKMAQEKVIRELMTPLLTFANNGMFKLAQHALDEKDMDGFTKFFDRYIGKPTETVTLNSMTENHTLTDEELDKRLKSLINEAKIKPDEPQE